MDQGREYHGSEDRWEEVVEKTGEGANEGDEGDKKVEEARAFEEGRD